MAADCIRRMVIKPVIALNIKSNHPQIDIFNLQLIPTPGIYSVERGYDPTQIYQLVITDIPAYSSLPGFAV